MARPITNRANHFSEYHLRLLHKIAWQIKWQFPVQFINGFESWDLVNEVWLDYLRYYPEERIKHLGGFIRKKMLAYLSSQVSHKPMRDDFDKVDEQHLFTQTELDYQLDKESIVNANKERRNM